MSPGTRQDAVFYEMLNSSAYIVTDPETADYFYLPIYIYWCGQLFDGRGAMMPSA